MNRYNLIQARGADFTVGTEGAAADGDGSDLVTLAITGGTIRILVPANVPDNKVCHGWLNRRSFLEMDLEDGTRISGWVMDGESELEAESRTRI